MKRQRPKIDVWTRSVASTVGLFLPQIANKFIASRLRLRSYTASTRRGADGGWRGTKASADEMLKKDYSIALARARYLERNSTRIQGALRKLKNNIVYTGIMPQVSFDNDAVADKVEEEFKEWAKKVKLLEKQRMVLQRRWVDGEVLAHFYIDPYLLQEGVMPLGIELLEAEHLDENVHGELANGNRAKRGIEFDKWNRPLFYHILQKHPGEHSFFNTDTKKIPASRIEHIFEADRPSQTRGMSLFAAIIMEMKELDDYQFSERTAARIASALGVFITTQDPNILAGGIGQSSVGSPYEPDEIPDYLEVGRITKLPYGTKIDTVANNRPGQTYEPYVKTSLKGISTSTGLSYENFSNDYAESSYSSARSAHLEERRGYRVEQTILNDRFNIPVFERFLEILKISNKIPEIKNTKIKFDMQNPGWTWVDPLKDSKACQTAYDLKTETLQNIASQQGRDWKEILKQRKKETEYMTQIGLIKGEDNA